MLDQSQHKRVVTKILLGLVSQKALASKLGFKGGTALYLFDDLDRFSTDLDFDLIGPVGKTDIQLIDQVVRSNLRLTDHRVKRFTLFWRGSYGHGLSQIKIEVSTRDFKNEYQRRDYRGYSVLVMKPAFMLAHKLCAVLDRKKLQNRDLYDVWWMLDRGFEAEERIVRERMGVSLNQYWGQLLELVRSLPDNYDILQGLGEVMTQSKKDWTRAKLLSDLELELASR